MDKGRIMCLIPRIKFIVIYNTLNQRIVYRLKLETKPLFFEVLCYTILEILLIGINYNKY